MPKIYIDSMSLYMDGGMVCQTEEDVKAAVRGCPKITAGTSLNGD